MLKSIYVFYRDGFCSMRLGRTLWKIVLIKVAVLLILGNFILPDYLKRNFSTPEQRAAHVLDNLTVFQSATTTNVRLDLSDESRRLAEVLPDGTQSTSRRHP